MVVLKLLDIIGKYLAHKIFLRNIIVGGHCFSSFFKGGFIKRSLGKPVKQSEFFCLSLVLNKICALKKSKTWRLYFETFN